ncbi:allene oxide cyclase barrel-like domain-containing protein [Streptomyces sp. NPDC002853]
MMGNNRSRSLVKPFAALSLAAVAIGVSTVGGAHADALDKSRVEVIELQLKDLEYESVDVGEAGPSLGDMSVYCATAVENGRVVGRGAGTSQVVYVRGGKVTSQAVITIELERGAVTMQSLQPKEASSLDMAITGGTGAFKDARGSVRYWDINTPQERLRAEILH